MRKITIDNTKNIHHLEFAHKAMPFSSVFGCLFEYPGMKNIITF